MIVDVKRILMLDVVSRNEICFIVDFFKDE